MVGKFRDAAHIEYARGVGRFYQFTRWCAMSGVSVVICSACAQSRALTWDDATETHATFKPAPMPFRESESIDLIEKSIPEPPLIAPPDLDAGSTIDRALLRFRAQRIESAALPSNAKKHGMLWVQVLRDIELACTVAPAATDLGAFVRARVTLEVERQSDKERSVALPPTIDDQLQSTLQAVDSRVRELRLSGLLGPVRPAPPLHDGDVVLQPPLDPLVVTSGFGVRVDPFHGRRRFHSGIDLGAPEGTMVYASAPGMVIYAGWQGGFGQHVVLDHGYGIRSHYSHLSAFHVRAGEMLEPGASIGAVGATGRATGPHLHFAITNADGNYVDPLRVLGLPFGPERSPHSAEGPRHVSAADSPIHR